MSSWTFFSCPQYHSGVMGPSGMGPGEMQDRGLSQIPSTPKGAFDCHTDTQPTNHKSIPLDSKTWVSLDGQLLWG